MFLAGTVTEQAEAYLLANGATLGTLANCRVITLPDEADIQEVALRDRYIIGLSDEISTYLVVEMKLDATETAVWLKREGRSRV